MDETTVLEAEIRLSNDSPYGSIDVPVVMTVEPATIDDYPVYLPLVLSGYPSESGAPAPGQVGTSFGLAHMDVLNPYFDDLISQDLFSGWVYE